MNWIICPVRNNIHLTREAVRTFRAQDIKGGVHILIINNGSTDGTNEWLRAQPDIAVMNNYPGLSVASSWNSALVFVFNIKVRSGVRSEYALVVNNDVELRPDTYRYLVADGGLFVTAVGSRDPKKIAPMVDYDGVSNPISFIPPNPSQKRPHPDFSCFLTRREAWDRVGPFDEQFKIAFCEDWDYHLRLHNAGIRAEALELPFLHHASQTVKNCDDREREVILKQAGLNREYFQQKWGVMGGTKDYYDLFGSTAPQDEETE